MRRLIAVGVGVAFMILLVLAFRGCLEARSDRGLSNYAEDIGTIMQESEQRGKDFFDVIDDSSGEAIDTQNQVAALRAASEQLLERAENLDVPGQMRDAQSAATLSLRLRRDALDSISDSVTKAAADTETDDAIESITNAMGEIYASDILWNQVSVPEIKQVLTSEGVDVPALPTEGFMPEQDVTKYLDQSEIATIFSGVSGSGDTSGTHGLGLVQTTLGGVALDPDTTNTVPSDANEVAVEVQNQGSVEETGIVVSVTVGGTDFDTDIATLGPGETATAKVPLSPLPQPGAEVTVEVLVQPVTGEADSSNNESSYTVIFDASAG